jgi:lauroyl/myristoyl acyltransferase
VARLPMKKEALAGSYRCGLFHLVAHRRSLPLSAAAALLSWIMRTLSDHFTRQDVIRENISRAFPDMTADKVKETGKNIAANLGVIASELSPLMNSEGPAMASTVNYHLIKPHLPI